MMKKCFCGFTIVGMLALTIIIIAIATAGESKIEGCPPYHYRDPEAKS